MQKKLRIGIMGGTFDPIHLAHLALAETAYEQYQLDYILFIPSNQPPHKEGHQIASVEDRVAMVLLAIEGNSHFKYSDIEINRQGKTYTADTLKELCAMHPEAEYYFILGADSLFTLPSWYQPESIFKNAVLLVGNRDQKSEWELKQQIDILEQRFQARICLLDFLNLEISSHELRQKAARGESIRYLVPDNVYTYIKKNGLY